MAGADVSNMPFCTQVNGAQANEDRAWMEIVADSYGLVYPLFVLPASIFSALF